jgi:integrase
MALDIKWTSNPVWSGRTVRNGKRVRIDTGVAVVGTPPPGRRLKGRGDEDFERSRMKAEIEFERKLAELESRPLDQSPLGPGRPPKKIEEGVTLDSLYTRFGKLPRKRGISTSSLSQAETLLERFVLFVRAQDPAAKFITDVDADIAEAFIAAEAERQVAPKTLNNYLVFMRSLFGRLQVRAQMASNPFKGIPKREEHQEHRVPFSIEELELILIAVRKQEHAFIRPAIITGISSAMRRKDCCGLRWDDVDLANGFVEVITSKTGGKVTIPLFPILAAEIKTRLPKTGEFVFPELQTMYSCNPDGITWRVKQALGDAGFFDADEPGTDGHRGGLTKVRKDGLRAASIRGFHSFRVTWATLALVAGVPVELVTKVTGHKSVDVLLESYFRPGREDFRRVLEDKMAKVFALGSPKPTLVANPVTPTISMRLKEMTVENWKSIRDELVAGLESPTPVKVDNVLLLK